MATALKGRKSSSSTSRKATRHDDTLFGTDTVELLLAISEGPVKGLVDGASSFYVGDVPLLDKGTQTPNISNFELRLLKGTNPADSIRLNLGGVASSKNIGLELRVANQAIVAQGDKVQIDYIDVRFVVQRLLAVSTEGGEFPSTLDFKIEIKPRSSNVWAIPFDNQPPPPVENTSGASNYRPGTTTPGTIVNDTYRETYLDGTPPAVAQAVGAMWFNTSTAAWDPRIWDGGAWQVPNGLVSGNGAGYPTWNWTDYDGVNRTAYFSPTGTAPPPGTLRTGDFLLTPQSGEEVYSYNATAWVGAQDFGTPSLAAPGVIQINGLTRSAYPKEYRIPVTRINEPYDVRVTRITAASTKSIFADITFESIQEVNRDAVSFPDLSVAWLTIKATDTFTSVPEFTGIYDGVQIPVPSNHVFDEATQLSSFSGLWDGTFKIAYTNNPAWHAYNFIKNARYGKNAYFQEVPDQWDFYEFGKHCSRHQFRFNEYIQDPRSINELINYICGIAGGRYVDRGDGYSTVIWDADEQVAQAIFAPENTIEGSFTYSFTDATERKNDFKVSFKNPGLNYREDRVRVWDQNTIDVVGRNAEEFVAVGCRDPEEAVRRGRLRLATSLSEKIIVNFKTNRLGRYLLPFQVILISDDQSTNVITGRIKNPDTMPIGTVSLPLRDQIYLEAGIVYSAQFTVSDGAGGLKVVSYPLTVAAPGMQSRLTLSQALQDPLPEYAVFSVGAPKPFRITSITPADDEPDQVEITAIEVNRLKWAFVRGEVELRDLTALQTGALSKFVYPVTGAKITPETTVSGGFNLIATWNPTETKLNRGYRVYQSINMGPMQLVGEPSECFYRIENAQAATYILSIVAVGLDGTTESAPVTVSYIISNGSSIRSVGMPSNLRLVNEPEAPIFRAINPQFTWDAAGDPLVSKYLVEVLNGASQVVYSERVEGQLLFTFTLAQNISSNGGAPLRQFTVRVRAIDSTGSISSPISLVVSHPPPAVISFDLDAVSETVFIQYTAPAGDWQGTLVWMETLSGFNPLTTSVKYDGTGSFIPLPCKPDTTYYVRLAAYDSYSKTGLNISPEKSIFTSIKLFDPNGPAQPTGLTLTTAAEINPADGSPSAVIRAVWNAPDAADTSYGASQVAISEGTEPNTSYVAFNVPPGQNSWELHNLKPGQIYSVKLRSLGNSKTSSDGPWTVTQTITAAKNLTAPANPTGLTVTATNETVFLAFIPSITKDVKWVEVWGFNGGSTAPTPPNGAILLGYVEPAASQYIDKVSTAQGRTYWLRAVNTSDVFAETYVRSATIIAPAINAAMLANEIIDATKLASSITAPSVVNALPGAYTTPFVTLTTDGKLYRWDAAQGRYTAAVPAADVGAGLTAAQIASVNATAVAGQLQPAQLAAIETTKLIGQVVASQLADASVTLAKFAAGTQPLGTVAALPSPVGYTGPSVVLNSDGKVYRLIGGQWVTSVTAQDISGTIAAGQIAALEAGKITGQLQPAQLAAIEAAKVVGQITSDQIAALSAAKISGQLQANQLAAIETAKLIGQVVSAQIADNSISLAKFDAGTQPISTVNGLPPVQNYQGTDLIYNRTDNKLYRYTGTAWVTSVTAQDISGTISAGQIAALEASKITGQLQPWQLAALESTKLLGQLQAEQLAAIETTKLVGQVVSAQIADNSISLRKFDAGTQPISTVQGLPPVSGYQGTLLVYNTTDNKIYRYTGTSWVASVASTDISGTISAGQIAALEASKITGQLQPDQLAALEATKLLGQLQPAQLAAIEATKVTGQLQAYQLAAMEASKITGQVRSDQIAALDAAKISGAITTTQISDNSISTAKLQAASVTASTIAASSITASKLAIVSSNLAYNANPITTVSGFSGAIEGGASYEVSQDTIYCPTGFRRFTVFSGSGTIRAGARLIVTNYPVNSDGTGSVYKVKPGSWYEFSAAYSSGFTAPATINAQIVWFNAAGGYISETPGPASASQGQVGGSVSTYPRVSVLAPAPNGAVSATLRVTAYCGVDQTGSNLGITALMFAEVTAGQVEPSPYVASGTTLIDGSTVITNTLTADRIVTGSITATQVAAASLTGDRMAVRTIDASRIVAYSITTNEIGAGSVSADRLVANSITAGQIAAQTITSAQIATRSITASNLVAFSITANELGAGVVYANNIAANTITGYQVAANSIFADRLVAGSITAAQISSNSISGDRLLANTIGTREIIANSITAGQIAVGSLTGDRLAVRTISADKIAAYSITANELGAGVVYAGNIAAGTITSGQIAAQTITTYQIATRTIQAANIAAGTITALEIEAATITAGQIAANTITGYQVAANSIFADRLVAGSITAAQISSNSISGDRLLANTIGTREIIANSITAGQIAANTITGFQIAAFAITSFHISANAVTAGKIDAGSVSAREITANAITTSKLQVASLNLAFNADGAQGTLGYSAYSSAGPASSLAADSVYAPSGFSRIVGGFTYTISVGQAAVIDNFNVTSNGTRVVYQVSEGTWYEFSYAFAQSFGPTVANIIWVRADGTYLSEVRGPKVYNGGGIGGSVRDYARAGVIGQAPPGATGAYLRMVNEPDAGSYTGQNIGMTALMFAPAVAGQTELSPYMPAGVSTLSGAQIVTGSLAASKIVAGSITADQVASNTITGDRIVASTIGSREIIARSITAFQIQSSTITTNEIAARTILAEDIVAGTLTGNEIAARTIRADQIVANSIGSNEIATRSITADKLVAFSITANEIGAGVVYAVNIAAQTITGNQLAANSVTAGKVDAGVIGAREIVASSIVGGNIAGNTIVGGHIQANTLVGGHIIAGTVSADRLVANSITAGQIAAGAISTAQLAASAITADKIGVGLNTGNLLWNSDLLLDGYLSYYQPDGLPVNVGTNDYFAVYGLRAALIHYGGATNSGMRRAHLYFNSPTSNGQQNSNIQVLPNQTYEASAYLSCHRARGLVSIVFVDGGSNYITEVGGSFVEGTGSFGSPNDGWRSKLLFTTPSNCAYVFFRVSMEFVDNTQDVYVFASAPYLGIAQPNQTQFSPYSPQSRTILSGGQIAANSIYADRIVAGTITTDRLQAGAINADRLELNSLKTRVLAAGAVTADTITVGNGTLSSLISGSNSVKIDGNSISANSIRAQQIQIGMRGLNVTGFNFRITGSTGYIQWDQGQIFWTDSNGTIQGVTVQAGGFQRSGNSYHAIVWAEGNNYLDHSNEINYANYAGFGTWVTMATYDNSYAGLVVNYGSTIIDGDRIITNSIKANKIAANEIQSYHMAANTITGDRIVAGSLAVDKLASGTITADNIYLRDDRFWMDGPNQLIRMRNRDNGSEQLSIGCVGKFFGQSQDFGMICRDYYGNTVIHIAGGTARIAGAYLDNASIGSAKIADAAITSAKIGNLQVGSAQIAELTVGTTKLSDLAATQVVALGTGGTDTGNAGIYIRGSGKVVVMAFFSGNSTQAIGSGPGSLIIQRDGNNIASVVSSFWTISGNGNVSYFLNAFSIVAIDTPGNGSHNYRAITTNAGGIGGVTLVVMECAK